VIFGANPISYVCGIVAFSWAVPYQVCIECPTAPPGPHIYTATMIDTVTSTNLFTNFQLTCTGTHQAICGFPTFLNALHPFTSYSLKFSFGLANFNNAGTSGDPHFRGFRDQTFDFQGEKGKLFNIISDGYSSVNALFSDPTHNTEKFVTYMTTFGIKFADLTVEIVANQTEGQIISNNVAINLPVNVEVKLSDCVFALYRKGTHHNAVQIQSNHEIFDFTLVNGEYINFGLKIKGDDILKLGGILGLTEKEDFNIENYQISEFLESDLFSSTSPHSSYSGSELHCSSTDTVSTLAPSQMTLPPKSSVARTAHVTHDVVQTFTTD